MLVPNVKPFWFNEARDDKDAMASAEPYHLYLTPVRLSASISLQTECSS